MAAKIVSIFKNSEHYVVLTNNKSEVQVKEKGSYLKDSRCEEASENTE